MHVMLVKSILSTFCNNYVKIFGIINLSTTHGYQFNPHIFVGAGVNCMTMIGESLWAYSANVRFDATSKGKLNPFFDLKTYFQKDIFF